jgi:hypothetical protein
MKLKYTDRLLTINKTGDIGNEADGLTSRAKGEKMVYEIAAPMPTHGAAVSGSRWIVQAFMTLGGKDIVFVIIIKKR